jgi:hypothetical protein
MVALRAHASPADVALTVMGVPPSHIVIPWEEAAIGGFAAAKVLSPGDRRALAATIPALWPPGPVALAAAAIKAVACIVGQSRSVTCCFVAPDDSSGMRWRAAALPVRLGPPGISRVELPTLTTRDQIALDNAMLL